MSTRPLQILHRFPAHLEAARPEKQLWAVVEALSADLDVLSTDLAAVRRAHRLGDADTLRDLRRLAELHGIGDLTDILLARAARVRALAEELVAAVEAHEGAARDSCAKKLLGLWALRASEPVLPLYAPEDPPDLDAAAEVLIEEARAAVSTRNLLEGARVRLAQICEIHGHGNATIRTLLLAVANALDLDVDQAKNDEVLAAVRKAPNKVLELSRTDGFLHSADRFVHLTYVRDRLGLSKLESAPELVGIEENPVDPDVRLGADGPGKVGPVKNGACFQVFRRGFANERLRIEIKGMNGRTKNVQFVHRDEGKAICFAGAVGDRSTLRIDEDGDLTLDGENVNAWGYSWRGGCFGDSVAGAKDWQFGGEEPGPRTAQFALATPEGALDPGATFPHGEVRWGGLGIALGLNRFALFVDEPAGAVPEQEVADVTLSWVERRPCSFKIWIPRRFKALDSPGELPLLERVKRAVERFRAMGVEAQAAYQDDDWLEAAEAMLAPDP